VANAARHPRILELPGRIIPDPDASGVVVAAVDSKPYWLERVPGWVKLCDVSKGGA
jgi:hypothetical protein